MTKEKVTLLLEKYVAGQLTRDEYDALFATLGEEVYTSEWQEMMDSIFHSPSYKVLNDELKQQMALRKILAPASSSPLKVVHRVHFLKTAWFRYAAIVILIACVVAYLYPSNHPRKEMAGKLSSSQQPDILPGSNKATLILSDGSRIVLDSVANGTLANEPNTKIVKLNAGILAYQGGNATGNVLYNTITTPKGGQYQIFLPDGSQVWLNAASSIRFPTAFAKNRKVTVTGEVYMEIAADKTKPFIVEAGEMQVQVLGTRFNINAYSDESAIKTTLIEGRVKVSRTTESGTGAANGMSKDSGILLEPGQQAFMKYAQPVGIIKTIDIEKVIAWKNGIFDFQGAGIEEVMRQLARWYDLEIVYEKGIPDIEFVGKLDKNVSLSGLLKAFEDFGLHVRIEKRKLIVMP